MFNVSSKSIKSCNKVMRICKHFHMHIFLYQTSLYVVFQSSIGVYFRTATNYLRLSFYKNRKQMLPASIMKKMLIIIKIIIIIKIKIIMINNITIIIIILIITITTTTKKVISLQITKRPQRELYEPSYHKAHKSI